MVSRSHFLIFAAIFALSGCNGDTTNPDPALAYDDNGIELPVRIRDSFAIDQNQVIGTLTINGEPRPMDRIGDRFQIEIPNLAINSSVVIQINFSEQLTDGSILILAESNEQTISTGTSDLTITFTQSEFNYSFDDDQDQISNIIEREQGTDPYTPENTMNRPVVVQFDIPARINEPDITRIKALVGGTTWPHTQPIVELGYRTRVTGLVSPRIVVEIRITLEQLYDGDPIDIAVATAERDAGDDPLSVTLTAADFLFNLDRDGDGIFNLDEIQSGTNPFEVN